MPVTRPALDRRATVVILTALAVVVLAVVVVVQVRATAAAAERERLAVAEQAAEQERLDAEAQAAREAADAEAEAEAEAARAAVEADWAAAVTEAQTRADEADALVAATQGAVTDDGPRYALAAAVQAVRDLVAAGAGGEVAAEAPAELRAAVAALAEPSATVAQVHDVWKQQQAALAAQAAAEERAAAEAAARRPAASGTPTSAGAGPDCGGPGSYEPPKNDGTPVFYTSTPSASGDGSNGRIPASRMTPLGWCQDSQGNKQWLRSDAAAALTRLNEAFRAVFGENIAVDMSYRSYEDQVAMRAHYGSMAARPGTSNHGTGVAIDTWEWRAYAFGSPRYDWLVANGPTYGWVAPDWARQGGSNPEYWHFEYVG